jgi:hypothetical protein
MYSSCIMSEEVWKQEYVHVFLLYNVSRSVETGAYTCIRTYSCFHTSSDIIQEEYMYLLLFPLFS